MPASSLIMYFPKRFKTYYKTCGRLYLPSYIGQDSCFISGVLAGGQILGAQKGKGGAELTKLLISTGYNASDFFHIFTQSPGNGTFRDSKFKKFPESMSPDPPPKLKLLKLLIARI